ncbi:MAG: pantetheine-phosphate adenylyltransferase [Planctomycetota bacterium]|nr:pantetheine-phosphate adenylyltransferase [Planctomycetota bacterium]
MPGDSTRNAVYVGSFDPPTLGHLDIIRRGARLFDRLIVGIGINPDKEPLFSPDERIALVGKMVSDLPNVEISCFDNLTVTFARNVDAAVLLRGVRTVSDIEMEFTMALTNHSLAPDIETVFLMASDKYSHISSTLIKQIARMGPDLAATSLERFVPACVIEPLLARYRKPTER